MTSSFLKVLHIKVGVRLRSRLSDSAPKRFVKNICCHNHPLGSIVCASPATEVFQGTGG
jgi:hypothetical protein